MTRATLVRTNPRNGSQGTIVEANRSRPIPLKGSRRALEVTLWLGVDAGGEQGEPPVAASISYAFRVREASGPEILAYHLHPGAGAFRAPHLHVSSGAGQLAPELQRAHLPTGSITLSQFVLMLIVDFGVAPLRPDWAAVLGSGTK